MTLHCIIFLFIPFVPILLAVMSGDNPTQATSQFGSKPSTPNPKETINYINGAFTLQGSVNNPKQMFNCSSRHSSEPTKTVGQACVFNQNDCSTHLTNMACVNNVCVCDATDRYDFATKRCKGTAGALCYPNIKECTDNAICINVPIPRNRVSRSSPFSYQTSQNYVLTTNSDIEVSGHCQCKEGFVESRDGLCKKEYGQSCQSFDECDTLNLVCKEGMCDCANALHVYDLITKSCVALVGAVCSDDAGGTVCVESAYCKKNNLKVQGRCSCIENAAETNMRTCIIPSEANVERESKSDPSGWNH